MSVLSARIAGIWLDDSVTVFSVVAGTGVLICVCMAPSWSAGTALGLLRFIKGVVIRMLILVSFFYLRLLLLLYMAAGPSGVWKFLRMLVGIDPPDHPFMP